jgi:hypothetical protein
MDSRAKRRKTSNQENKTVNAPQQWQQHRAFGALDWASQTHCVVVVEQTGKVIEDFQIAHSALGWKKFREKLQPYGSIPFAIETSQGAAVEQLLEAGMMVYPLNPKSAQAYRERKAPSGVKDDQLDAWSFADALRTDGRGWKALKPEEPLIKELRLLCLRLPLECGVTVIAAHCGTRALPWDGNHFEDFLKMRKEFQNFYGDLSALSHITHLRSLEQLREEPERLLHGTDYPVVTAVFPSWLKGWISKETMQRLRAIRNPLEKKIELTRALGFPERVFTDLWDLIPILRPA